MTKQQLDEQVGYLLAVHHITLEAALRMEERLDKMLPLTGQAYQYEAKMHYNSIRKHLNGLMKDMEFFELEVIPALITKEGRTDTISVYDSFINDSYAFAREMMKLYNERLGTNRLDKTLIESFKLKEKDD